MATVDPLTLLLLYRTVTMVIGFGFAYLGFRLFDSAVNRTSDVEAVYREVRVLLKRAAPGTVFAFFGAVLIGISLWKGVQVDTSSPTLGRTSAAPSDMQELLQSQQVLYRLAQSGKLTDEEHKALDTLLFRIVHIEAALPNPALPTPPIG
jgi:hypothetical protein